MASLYGEPQPKSVAAEAARIMRDIGPPSALSLGTRTRVQRPALRLEFGPVWRIPTRRLEDSPDLSRHAVAVRKDGGKRS